jgi:hypothetical protein
VNRTLSVLAAILRDEYERDVAGDHNVSIPAIANAIANGCVTAREREEFLDAALGKRPAS